MSEQREALAEALYDAAFPGEREKDPYWYQAYEHDWYAQADRLLASDPLARLLADAEQRGADRVAETLDLLALTMVSTADDEGTALTAAVLQRAATIARASQ